MALRSEYVAEMVHAAVDEARDSLERTAETTAKAMEAAERRLNETMSAFIAWAARHGVDVDDARDARMTLRFEVTASTESVHVAADGTRALDFLYQRGDYTDAPCPDLILLRPSNVEVKEDQSWPN